MFTWTGSKGIKYLPLCLYPCRSVNSPITNPIGSDSILCMNTSQVIYCSLNSSITFFSFTVLILKANLLLIKISCWQWLNVHTERLLFTFFSVHSQIQAPKLNKKVFQDLWGRERQKQSEKEIQSGGIWGCSFDKNVTICKLQGKHCQWHCYFFYLSSFSIIFNK